LYIFYATHGGHDRSPKNLVKICAEGRHVTSL